MGETSRTSSRIRCFTLKCVLLPQSFICGCHVCPLFFHGLVLGVRVKSSGPGESNSRGIGTRRVCVLSARLSTRTDIRDVPSNSGHIVILLTSGSRTCSPWMFRLLVSHYKPIISNQHQSEDLPNHLRSRRPRTNLDQFTSRFSSTRISAFAESDVSI